MRNIGSDSITSIDNVRGGVIQMAAISRIEIALWDIKGKALGVPVWQLIGGQMRERIWTYGRFDGQTPELAVERALREVDTGLTALKGDPFGHQGLFITPEAAIRIGNALEAFRPFVFEEPVPPQNVDAMAKVAQAMNIPLATGERLYSGGSSNSLRSRSWR